jgi:hypothetical protein
MASCGVWCQKHGIVTRDVGNSDSLIVQPYDHDAHGALLHVEPLEPFLVGRPKTWDHTCRDAPRSHFSPVVLHPDAHGRSAFHAQERVST